MISLIPNLFDPGFPTRNLQSSHAGRECTDARKHCMTKTISVAAVVVVIAVELSNFDVVELL